MHLFAGGFLPHPSGRVRVSVEEVEFCRQGGDGNTRGAAMKRVSISLMVLISVLLRDSLGLRCASLPFYHIASAPEKWLLALSSLGGLKTRFREKRHDRTSFCF